MSEPTDLNASSASENTDQTPQLQDPYAAIVLPENSSLSADMLAALKQQAAQIKLPLPVVQKWVEQENNRLDQQVKQQAHEKQEQVRVWAQETRALYDEEEISRAVRAADAFGGPELRQLLEETGLGNHPAIVRTFAAVGKRIAEDISVVGTAQANTDKTFTQALYAKQ